MNWKEKGAIAKKARQLIVKERKSHQFAFDEMITGIDKDNKFIAEAVAKTTSHKTQERLKSLIWVFIICLSLVAILRVIGIIELLSVANVNIVIIVPIVLFSIIISAIGIATSLTNKLDRVFIIGVMLLIGIMKGFTSKDAQVETGTRQLDINGKIAAVQNYTFETEANDQSNILDDGLLD